MENKNALEYWQTMASSNPDEKTTKINPANDYSEKDATFILRYAGKDTEILDLASGTGLIINKLCNQVGHIDAIELFPDFSKFIKETPQITVFNQDITEFETDKQYDIVTMFGIVSYFNQDEIIAIYRKYIERIKTGGRLIVKNQFGVKEDVEISGFSNELKRNYFSQYRHLDKEIRILKETGFRHVEAIDIYPPECNRWDNTHFYAIIAEK